MHARWAAHTVLRYLARYVHKSALSEPRPERKVRLNCQESHKGRRDKEQTESCEATKRTEDREMRR